MTIGRRLILDNIVSSLETIDGTGDYTTTVSNVYRHVRTWNETLQANRIAVCVAPGTERYEYQSSNCVRVIFTIDLLAHINEDSETSRINTINDLIDDLWIALMGGSNQVRGGNAVATRILEVVTDEADVAGQESLRMSLEVTYFRTLGVSN